MTQGQGGLLFQQYRDTLQRERSVAELTQVKRQQFKSLIMQQKQTKNNIGSIISNIVKKHQLKKQQSRNNL